MKVEIYDSDDIFNCLETDPDSICEFNRIEDFKLWTKLLMACGISFGVFKNGGGWLLSIYKLLQIKKNDPEKYNKLFIQKNNKIFDFPDM
jgi:hypothetical protein